MRTERTLSLALASQIATEAVAACAASGHAVAATVVDRAGGFLPLGGGVPIKVGNDTMGAVGIGGAPGRHLESARSAC